MAMRTPSNGKKKVDAALAVKKRREVRSSRRAKKEMEFLEKVVAQHISEKDITMLEALRIVDRHYGVSAKRKVRMVTQPTRSNVEHTLYKYAGVKKPVRETDVDASRKKWKAEYEALAGREVSVSFDDDLTDESDDDPYEDVGLPARAIMLEAIRSTVFRSTFRYLRWMYDTEPYLSVELLAWIVRNSTTWGRSFVREIRYDALLMASSGAQLVDMCAAQGILVPAHGTQILGGIPYMVHSATDVRNGPYLVISVVLLATIGGEVSYRTVGVAYSNRVNMITPLGPWRPNPFTPPVGSV